MNVMQESLPMLAPPRTLVQRMEALDKANEIRCARAALKKRINRGEESVPELLREPPDFIDTMKVPDLLGAMRGYGPTRVNKMLLQTRMSPKKTVGGLSMRQRQELAGLIKR